jgi:hypothetical protein
MVSKALAAFVFAAILLCVGVFDSAPADAQGYARAYRGGAGVGIYRGPRGGVAVRAGYGGGYRTGYYGGRGYGGRGYGGGYRTGYYGGRGYGVGYRTGYYGGGGYYGGYDDTYTDAGYQTVGYEGDGYYGGDVGYGGGCGCGYGGGYGYGYGGGYGYGYGGGYGYPIVRLGGAWMQTGYRPVPWWVSGPY